MIDIQEKKRKIISFLETNGPSLPVRIAKTIQMDPVFASAILSELLGSKQIKTSNMKIGSSPLYLIPGQEKKLEEHTIDLKPIEKEAYIKLKEKKLILDEEEEPATRVALRNIKDFAVPFKFHDKIMWKYSFTPEKEIEEILTEKPEEENRPEEISEEEKEKTEQEEEQEEKKIQKKVEPIFEKKQETKKEKTFLKKIEEFLERKNTKIISIEEVNKKKVIAKTLTEDKKAILFAFKKRRINEEELMKCYKRASMANLPYHIILIGDTTKKMSDTIDAYKKLIKIEKLDNQEK